MWQNYSNYSNYSIYLPLDLFILPCSLSQWWFVFATRHQNKNLGSLLGLTPDIYSLSDFSQLYFLHIAQIHLSFSRTTSSPWCLLPEFLQYCPNWIAKSSSYFSFKAIIYTTPPKRSIYSIDQSRSHSV